MSRLRRGALLAGLSLLRTAHAAQPDPDKSPNVAPAASPAPAAPALSFVPVPEIDLDPNSGNTFGLIGVWLDHDAAGAIQRIYAPDIIHNPYFGWGARARVFDYSSTDSQWSVVAGAKQHVESEFDALYQYGRERQDAFAYTVEAVYDRSGRRASTASATTRTSTMNRSIPTRSTTSPRSSAGTSRCTGSSPTASRRAR